MSAIQQTAAETVTESIHDYYNAFLEILPRIALGILVIIVGVLIATLLTNIYKKRILKKAEDPLMAKFLAQSIKLVLTVIAILIALQVAGLSGVATGILTAAGGAAIVLGFAFQDIGKNFLAGIILAFNRPFSIDDTIKVSDLFGKVKALNFRYMHLKTFDGRDIYVPNSDVLTKPVENYTADGFFRNDFVVGIGYEDDIDRAKHIIQSILNENEYIVHDKDHENFVFEDELATSTVNLKVYFWVNTLDYKKSAIVVRGNLIREVKQQLEDEGINLPADIQELKLYGNEKDIPLRMIQDPGNIDRIEKEG
ncbi:mechanosensitive ion channel family protein [Winogradskyella bathintestinalis]|uniref:Mechanosensitive ion channel family protein n=1 Tax=Winogradskyella bathintestinalis TaxID=3035208 RepID=A0ABT7ZX74_9FLAO|nr:mechanosensitive ion channel family protein [Winogradskyella bathintestinalis]MDN3493611.1 mechanosensitive ion channel family protein [Winogradskyella bathintestinalis]